MGVKDNSFGIAELQDKMLEILKYFISVCENNQLRYWVGGGTCLGAIRHKGFIPWDDDLDVFMPRPDYEKLWCICHGSSNEKYVLCRTTREKNYHHRVMQMVDATTTFINRRSVDEDIEHGVYVDIIPMDACANSLIGKYIQRYHAIVYSVYNIQCLPEFQGTYLMKFATMFLLWLVKNPEKRYKKWKYAEEKMTRYSWEDAEDVIELTTSFKSLLRSWPKEWFETEQIQFEDIKVNVPKGADHYMHSIYGSYMQLPPVEEQRVRHNTVFVDLKTSYTNYKGIYYCVNKCEMNK